MNYRMPAEVDDEDIDRYAIISTSTSFLKAHIFPSIPIAFISINSKIDRFSESSEFIRRCNLNSVGWIFINSFLFISPTTLNLVNGANEPT